MEENSETSGSSTTVQPESDNETDSSTNIIDESVTTERFSEELTTTESDQDLSTCKTTAKHKTCQPWPVKEGECCSSQYECNVSTTTYEPTITAIPLVDDDSAPETATQQIVTELKTKENSDTRNDSNITTASSTRKVTTTKTENQEMTTEAETQDNTGDSSEQIVAKIYSATETTTLPNSLTAEGSRNTNTDDLEETVTEYETITEEITKAGVDDSDETEETQTEKTETEIATDMNEIIVLLGSYETNETQMENTESSPTLDNSNIAVEYADEVHKIPTIESIDPLNKIKEEASTQATDNLPIVIPAENDVNSDHNEEIDNKDN